MNQEKINDSSKEFIRANTITDLLIEKQVEDVLLLDLQSFHTFTDFFIIGTVDNVRQSKTVSDLIHKQKDIFTNGAVIQDGNSDSGWTLLDVGGIVIHLFTRDTREYYDLESLWSDAKTILRIH
ncbi:MAG: ribosome silencing factor [Dehalococcoidia bacterium]|mgnify:CR=1 FL=1|jgi:ribosome-associated protein|nr:MAG: ribosome-associated protein [Chloroflexota bacterium]|tara:strand:+ start:2133 stop:2504 length:372 start_codon:yes stop_codon:yes gene_type:complete